MHKKNLFVAILVSVFSSMLFAGVLSSPRKIKVISTKYFDITFPDECVVSAKHLADNADELFEKAIQKCGPENIVPFRMPVIISPDSDVFSVKYTPTPYNRVVIYEGISETEDACYDDSLLSGFYHELLIAARCSIRTPFNQFISRLVNTYQPVNQINAPQALLEGAAVVDESDAFLGRLNDEYYLQILSQAKVENKFPTWIQAFAKRDVYPYEELTNAAAAAFLAFLQQRWGISKYAEFWQACGGLHFYLTTGIFYKTYGVKLAAAWREFIDSIPVPENIEQIRQLENFSTELIQNDNEGLYEFLINTRYGVVWYDGIRHEVDIYDINNPDSIRKLLFLADDVTNLTVSPDERFVVVSFVNNKTRDNFKQDSVLIYDLMQRTFVSNSLSCRDASVVMLPDGTYGLAGIDVTEKHPKLVIYRAGDLNNYLAKENARKNGVKYEKQINEIIYTRYFEDGIIPSSPIYAGAGIVTCLIESCNEWDIFRIDLKNNLEKIYSVFANNTEKLKIRNMRLQADVSANKLNKNFYYTFQYFPAEITIFTRMGFISLNEEYEMQDVYLQKNDFYGGVHFPVFRDDELYYISKKLTHNELRIISPEYLEFTQANLVEANKQYDFYDFENQPAIETYEVAMAKKRKDRKVSMVENYKLENYNPFSYMFKGVIPGGIVPFLAIRDISLGEGPEQWPALGLTYVTHADPFLNNEIKISGAYDFLKLDFTKIFNPTKEMITEEYKEDLEHRKNVTFAAFVGNSSTPVDIQAGALFKFNSIGEYEFKVIGGTSWVIPMGMSFTKLTFNIDSELNYSTDYYDSNKIDTHPRMKDWPELDKSYSFTRVASSLEYTNINQYGISAFEKRGLKVGASIYAFWDFYDINEKNKQAEANKPVVQAPVTENTDATSGSVNGYNDPMMAAFVSFMDTITQCNISLYSTLEIPRLNPLQMINGWVLSVPATINFGLMNETGKAMKSSAEFLLVGKEIQNGIPFLYTYFARAGLRFGYDLNLVYDTNVMSLPDLRQIAGLSDIFMNTKVEDCVYLRLSTNFVLPVGALSNNIFNVDLKLSFYPSTQAVKFAVNFEAKF